MAATSMTSPPAQALESQLTKAWPPSSWQESHVVLAVSGGADSVAMLRATLAVKHQCRGRGRLFVAHLNHGWRAADADADQHWLESLCRRLDVPLETGRIDVQALAAADHDGLEAAARNARYEFLARTAEKLGARFVAVAHTADDQVETVLHRILRGTGLAGLAGMRFSRPLAPSVALVRPLLSVRRPEVLEYLDAIGQDYRVDRTNIDTRWTRNRLRHELLPLLRERYNARVDDALLRLAAQADQSQQVVAELAERLARECLVVEAAPQPGGDRRAIRLQLDCRPLQAIPPLLAREVCKIAWRGANWPMQAMGYEAWQQLAELIQKRPGDAANLPGNVRARRENDWLVLRSHSAGNVSSPGS